MSKTSSGSVQYANSIAIRTVRKAVVFYVSAVHNDRTKQHSDMFIEHSDM